MAAAGLGIALQERFFLGVEKEEGEAVAFVGQGLELVLEAGDAVAGAGVDADRHLADAFLLEHAHENRQHHHRQIVDAIVVGVFQEVEGDGLARTGEAADEDEVHGSGA